jgi:ArsR family transcriptional regulator, lead/cadmium/zinc/bismuth-responsive transcriptional repressor
MKCATQSTGVPAGMNKPALRARPLINQSAAKSLSSLFKMLSSETRLRLLHALERADELCVTDLACQIGMAPQAISNQLQRLTDRQIVIARREGTRLFYRIADPCVPGLLDLGLCLLEETKAIPNRSAAGKRRGR